MRNISARDGDTNVSVTANADESYVSIQVGSQVMRMSPEEWISVEQIMRLVITVRMP